MAQTSNLQQLKAQLQSVKQNLRDLKAEIDQQYKTDLKIRQLENRLNTVLAGTYSTSQEGISAVFYLKKQLWEKLYGSYGLKNALDVDIKDDPLGKLNELKTVLEESFKKSNSSKQLKNQLNYDQNIKPDFFKILEESKVEIQGRISELEKKKSQQAKKLPSLFRIGKKPVDYNKLIDLYRGLLQIMEDILIINKNLENLSKKKTKR